MKKTALRVITIILIIVMCASMAVPAFADLATVKQTVASYPERLMDYINDGYVGLIQRVMCAYSETTRDYIIQGLSSGATKVDAVFGPNTKKAVIAFQENFSQLNNDGVVGKQTWGEISSLLKSSSYGPYDGYSLYSINGYVVMGVSGSTYKYYPWCARSSANASYVSSYETI